MVADPFRIIAHRGASAYAPENTLAAFRRAGDMGLDEVETDIGFTRDKQLLLFHDSALDRTTNGSGPPADYTLAELKKLDAGSWMDPAANPGFAWDRDYSGEPLITLDELLETFGRQFTYHLEIKDRVEGIVPAIVDRVRHFGLVDRAFITIGNDEAFLRQAKQLEPNIRTALAASRHIRTQGIEAIDEIARAGHDMVTLSSANLSRALVERAHALGMEARSSGIRNRQQMIAAVEAGCNGMTINWPDWLQDYIAAQS